MSTELSASELIDRCRRKDSSAQEQLFARYRHYLWLLAQGQLGRHLRGKCDASDLVQQTLLEAYRDFPRFSGKHENELLAWLRKILAHNLFNEVRRFQAQQRDAAREISIDHVQAGLEHSSMMLARCLAANTPTPSRLAEEREAAVRLADKLSELPEDYRMVLLLRIFEGLPAEEVAQRMNRTAGAVRMLQLRALTAMRELLEEAS